MPILISLWFNWAFISGGRMEPEDEINVNVPE